MIEFDFPVGYREFHRKQLFNFQLNRWYSLGYARREDMEKAGRKIRSFKDWKNVMVSLGEEALGEERLINAAFYYRAAEFYIKARDSEKDKVYNRFLDLFDTAFASEKIERLTVPYEGAFLPVMRIPPAAGKKGTILMHGGFDSFIEEWFSMMKYFSELGYEVIGFEGPGQGAALRKYGLPLIYEWEKPVSAVINYLDTGRCTLIGLSLGGWLCLRAAALEHRIERVISSGHAIDYMKSMPPVLRHLHLWCIEHCRDFMDKMATMKFEKRDGMAPWMVDHLKYITRKDKPLDALQIYLDLNEQNIHSDLVTQDVLLMTGRDDHFIPFKMLDMQIKALKNAKSVTSRVFTKEEQGQNHCQVGNIGLSLEVMAEWIATT
ncbi:MAG: alpha/beta hydrolase [Candidatus Krumholzibacteriota bacterium]|nr:alpha/beta hydrolase [Candidatus Krumholzibacteriota bacterium]